MNREIDLNLLQVLILLERHRQLKPVAKTLGKSEASISKYLTRLRTQLGDELFIRHAHHFESTDYLKRKLPHIEEALDTLNACLVKSEFDPLSYDKKISIALPQSAQYGFGHKLLDDLVRVFPNANIHIGSILDHSAKDLLEERVDVQMHYFNEDYPKTIYQKFIGYAPAAIIVPSELGVLEFKKAMELRFILLEVVGGKDREQVTEQILTRNGFNINCIATIGNLSSLLKAAKSCGAATILHEFHRPIDGFDFIPIPEELYQEGRPRVVVQMKQTHKHNAMHQLLTDAIAKYIKC
ncbi:LysR family transcriptional regulator [Vibrio rotiferianus]|uniref:LysR family transcriptional regulator n=1 Tax=Vibrio rotiferianus TaxID=190895 RepID=UPI00390BAE86